MTHVVLRLSIAVASFVLLSCSAGWRDPELIEARSADAYNVPQVTAGNGLRSGLVVLGFTGPAIKVSRFMEPWSPPITLGTGFTHAVAMGVDGTAMALIAGGTAIRFNGTTWGAPASLGEVFGGWPSVGADATGNFVAAWPDAAATGIRAAQYLSSSGFQPAVSIGHTAPAARVESVSVAVNAGGSAVVAWCERRTTGAAIAANLFVPGRGWGTATDLEIISECVASPDPSFWPNVASVDTGITNLGVASAVWSSNGRVHLRRYAPGAGWRPTEALTSAGRAINPKIAVSLGTGDIIVAWKEEWSAVHARRYSAASGFWTPDTPLGGGGAIPTLAVGIDERGRGMVAFSDVNPGGGWAASAARFNESFRPAEIVGIPMATAYELDLAMSRDGYAFLVWAQSLRNVWGVVYHP